MSGPDIKEINKILSELGDGNSYRARLLAAFRYQESERPDSLIEDPLAYYFRIDQQEDLDDFLKSQTGYQQNSLCRKYIQNRSLRVRYEEQVTLSNSSDGSSIKQSLNEAKKKLDEFEVDHDLEGLIEEFEDVLIDPAIIYDQKIKQRSLMSQKSKQNFRVVGDLLGRIVAMDYLIEALVDPQKSMVMYKDIQEKFLSQSKAPIRQIVLLQSGFDGRPYRLESLKGTQVYELDKKEMIQKKQQILTMIGAQLSKEDTSKKYKIPLICDKLKFVEFNYDATSWGEGLINQGFDIKLPTLWLAQEVIFDMTDEQIQQMMKICQVYSGKGSVWVCDAQSAKGLSFVKRLLKTGLVQSLKWGFPPNHEEYFQKLGWETVLYKDVDTLTKQFSLGVNYASMILNPTQVIIGAFMKL